MQRYDLIHILLCLFGLYSFSFSNLDEAGTQFISYNGSISGDFKHSQSAPSNCSAYYFDSLQNTIVKVGVNPPWDTNPFYFSIQHDGRVADPEHLDDGDICMAPFGCTYDPVYNLFLETAIYRCLASDGSSCGVIEWNFYFDPEEVLNLNKATTVQFDGEEKGYSTIGNQSTFVGDNKTVYDFSFQRPRNYTEQRGCVDELGFKWNATTPFTYALNFTNTSATGLFSLTAHSGTLKFSFSGARVDDAPRVEPYNNGNYTPMALDTSDPLQPNFTFANGSEIIWKNYSNGWGAIAAAAPMHSVKIGNLETQLKWLSVMVIAGCIAFL